MIQILPNQLAFLCHLKSVFNHLTGVLRICIGWRKGNYSTQRTVPRARENYETNVSIRSSSLLQSHLCQCLVLDLKHYHFQTSLQQKIRLVFFLYKNAYATVEAFGLLSRAASCRVLCSNLTVSWWGQSSCCRGYKKMDASAEAVPKALQPWTLPVCGIASSGERDPIQNRCWN